ncbi:MAG: lysophospholipid acyltransferase family protein, partial [Planctomycetota bacterium]
ARTCARILGVRTEVRGTPPSGSFLLLSNHLSYIDILVLLGRADAVFVAKSEIATWPVLGFLARTTGTIFVDRERRRDLTAVNRAIGVAFDRGYGVVLFPEGTSGRGEALLPFKPSIFEVAFREPAPTVRVASLAYSTPENSPPADLSVCWWGDMGFFGHFLGALGLPSVRAILTFSGETLLAANRKELAQRAHRAVSEIFTPSARAGCARE